ncbi:protein SAR DEFICIENT 1-like [Rutidosis leptorrhynchoides]|uniref:protein SAR DEFICIENT 1-like n=1 Tax=Rutidosis leptorrhynchoides TaxID=125765 RepID=UPI003A9A3876
MAAKRFSQESSSSDDQEDNRLNERRIRTRPSLASVIGEVVMINSLQNLSSTIEPLFRRVVNEEMERILANNMNRLNRSPLRIQAIDRPSSLKLMFTKTLSLPIFTGSKIVDIDNSQPQIIIVDTRGEAPHTSLPHPLKVEIVVLDGDFPAGNRDSWTSEEFDNNIVKERTGKRPLLAGELSVMIRNGFALIGEIEFTDNSSWIRSRKFRIGVKVATGSYQGVRICEAMTEAFVVKDHRGELYKKHHPPSLGDEVWRLEKIGKDGAFHKKLQSVGIETVQDFLKLSTLDTSRLRTILGPGMSDKMWGVTMKHARTCILGNRQYILRGPNCTIVLNPICQVVHAEIDHHLHQGHDLNRIYIDNLVKQAYENWSSLEEIEGPFIDSGLLTSGEEEVDQYPNQQTIMGYLPSTSHTGCDDW